MMDFYTAALLFLWSWGIATIYICAFSDREINMHFVMLSTAVLFALFGTVFCIEHLADSQKRDADLVAAMFTASALFFAVSEYFHALSNKQDEATLRKIIEYYENAYDAISDGNNKRVKWLESARYLMAAKLLKSKLSKDAIETLNADEIKWRIQFADFLEKICAEPETGAFFYGFYDKDGKPIRGEMDEVAKNALKRETRALYGLNQTQLSGFFKYIPPEAIAEIVRFTRTWPGSDPYDKIEEVGDEEFRMLPIELASIRSFFLHLRIKYKKLQENRLG